MGKIDDVYFMLAFIWLVAGMAFGMWLGATEHFQFAESHAHMSLVGFVISAIFGAIYRFYPAMKVSRMALLQLLTYQIGAVLLVAGKIVVDAGGPSDLVKLGSVVILAGVLLMLYVFAFRRTAAVVEVAAQPAT